METPEAAFHTLADAVFCLYCAVFYAWVHEDFAGVLGVTHRLNKWVVPVALCAVIVLGGCTRITHEKKDGEALVTDMHSAMSRGDWKEIYAGADPALKAGTSEDKFGSLFIAIAKKLGNPVSFTATKWNLDKASDGTFLKSTCETKFSNNASGTETFEWRQTDGKYLLFSYHIKSDELDTQ
jgi:hypothetical protein